MAILHIQKRDNPYVMIDKRPLDNSEMSWQAKGLLCYLLSKPASWNVCVEDLITRSRDGKAAVYSTLKELEELGHLVKKPHREKGRIAKWVYDVFEEPQATSRISRSRNSSSRKSTSGKSATSNNEGNSNNDPLSNNEGSAAVASPAPASETPPLGTPPGGKEEKEKTSAQKEKEESEKRQHQAFVDTYHQWYQDLTKIAPRYFESDFKAIKSIRRYLIDSKKGDYEKALSTWRYILDNWGKLEDFLQRQMKLTQIDRNMVNILNQLRTNYIQGSKYAGDKSNNSKESYKQPEGETADQAAKRYTQFNINKHAGTAG